MPFVLITGWIFLIHPHMRVDISYPPSWWIRNIHPITTRFVSYNYIFKCLQPCGILFCVSNRVEPLTSLIVFLPYVFHTLNQSLFTEYVLDLLLFI